MDEEKTKPRKVVSSKKRLAIDRLKTSLKPILKKKLSEKLDQNRWTKRDS